MFTNHTITKALRALLLLNENNFSYENTAIIPICMLDVALKLGESGAA